MRTTFRAAAAALVFTAVAGIAQAQGTAAAPQKLAYVNTSLLMQAAPGRAAAESLYARDARVFQAQQKTWSDSLGKLIAAYTKAEPAMTPARKATEQEKIQVIQNNFENMNTLGQQKMQVRQNEVLAPLMELVRSAIDDIRSEGGYAFIFSGDENSPIVSADKNLDLTEKVIARLKTMAAKTATPATPSSMAPSALTKKPPTR